MNTAPYLHGVHKSCPLLWEKTLQAGCTQCLLAISLAHYSLAPRPMTVDFGLGMRLNVHVYKIRKWHSTQRTAAL